MFQVVTARLILAQTPLHVLQTRLEQPSFHADVPVHPEAGAGFAPAGDASADEDRPLILWAKSCRLSPAD